MDKRPLFATILSVIFMLAGGAGVILNMLMMFGVEFIAGASEEYQALGPLLMFKSFVGPGLSLVAGSALFDMRRNTFWFFFGLACWSLGDQFILGGAVFWSFLLYYLSSLGLGPHGDPENARGVHPED